jgi:hypothetical protein
MEEEHRIIWRQMRKDVFSVSSLFCFCDVRIAIRWRLKVGRGREEQRGKKRGLDKVFLKENLLS